MELSSSLQTAFFVGYSLDFLPMALIIQRSMVSNLPSYICLNTFLRILLACIKYLGEFLCPRCLIPKSRIPDLGTEDDKEQRENLARVDDKKRRKTIEKARKRMYVKGININSKSIKDLLGPKSWTPTRVGGAFLIVSVRLELITMIFRMHFR